MNLLHEDPGNAWRIPGMRRLVRDGPDWWHERFFAWPITTDRRVERTDDGNQYGETFRNYDESALPSFVWRPKYRGTLRSLSGLRCSGVTSSAFGRDVFIHRLQLYRGWAFYREGGYLRGGVEQKQSASTRTRTTQASNGVLR